MANHFHVKTFLDENFTSVLSLMFVTHSHLKNEWPRGQNETIFFSRETNFVGIALHLFKFSDPQSWSNHRSGNLATAQSKVFFNQVLRWAHWWKYFGGFLLISKKFPDFPLCEYRIASFNLKLFIKRSKSVLPEREIRKMFY